MIIDTFVVCIFKEFLENSKNTKLWIDLNTKSNTIGIYYDKESLSAHSEEAIAVGEWDIVIVEDERISNIAVKK